MLHRTIHIATATNADQGHLDDFKRYSKRLPPGRRLQLQYLTGLYTNFYASASCELASDTRYGENQVCVLSQRPIQPQETIVELIGVTAPLSEQVVSSFTATKSDFSLIVSPYGNSVHLLLGPLRFVNHSCRPNCRMRWKQAAEVHLQAIKPIDVSEELTVYYGPEYFGEENDECCCPVCTGV